MASFKALCLAGVASLAATATAHAADLLPPPPPVEAPAYIPQPAPAIGGGWYLRGDVGAAVDQLDNEASYFTSPVPDFGSAGYAVQTTALVDVGAGYQFNNWFRADVTGEYRFGAKYKAAEFYSGSPNCPTGSGYLCVDGYDGRIANAVFLVNGYVQLGTWYGATPYIGAGVGAALNMFDGLTDSGISNPGAGGVAQDSTTAHLAWAVMAGVSYNLTQNVALDIGFRYLDMGHVTSGAIACSVNLGCPNEVQRYHMTSEDIRLGLRYTFADLIPQQLPLIRKY